MTGPGLVVTGPRPAGEPPPGRASTRGTVLAILWLLAFCASGVPLAPFALIFAAEGAASLRAFPENLLLTLAAALFLVAWPASAVAGWVLLAVGRPSRAWRLTALVALLLALLFTAGLLLAAVVGRARAAA